MAGFMAENIAKGAREAIPLWRMWPRCPRDGSVTLLDARTPQEYAKGNAEGFVQHSRGRIARTAGRT